MPSDDHPARDDAAFHTSTKFRGWLRSREPREQPIARFGSRDQIKEPCASRAWNPSIDRLQRTIRTSADRAALLPSRILDTDCGLIEASDLGKGAREVFPVFGEIRFCGICRS